MTGTVWTAEQDAVSLHLAEPTDPLFDALDPGDPLLSHLDPSLGSDDLTVDMTDLCGAGYTSPRSLHYRANYNQHSGTGQFSYENGLTYRTVDGRTVGLSEQGLIDGSTVQLTPLVGSQRHKSGTATTTLRFQAGTTGETKTVGIPLVLVVPSELSVATWQDLLAEEDRVAYVTELDGRIAIVLAAGDYTIRCTPIGIDTTPTNQPTALPDSDDPDINPAAPGDIKLIAEDYHSNSVTLTFENIGGVDKNVSEARLNFYHGSTGNVPTQGALGIGGGDESAVLFVGDAFESLHPEILLPAEATEDVELVFDGNSNNHDWFVLTLVFDSGERGTYVVALR